MGHQVFIQHTYIYKCSDKACTEEWKINEAADIEMRFIGDSELKPKFICTKRTAKTVTFEKFCSNEKPMSRRIKTYNNVEYILDGQFLNYNKQWE